MIALNSYVKASALLGMVLTGTILWVVNRTASNANLSPLDGLLDPAELDQFLLEQQEYDERSLQEGELGQINSLCGKRNGCAAGLKCMRWASLQRRCIPAACLEQELKTFYQTHDMKAYTDMILAEAQVTPEAIVAELQQDQRRRPIASSSFMRAMEVMEQHQEPQQAFFAIGQKCFGTPLSDQVTWSGMHVEAGLLLDVQVDGFTATSNFEGNQGFNKVCVGAEILGGLEVLTVMGMTTTAQNSSSALQCASIMADADLTFVAGAANASLGCAAGVHFNGVPYMETTVAGSGAFGVGAGAGVSFCGAGRV